MRVLIWESVFSPARDDDFLENEGRESKMRREEMKERVWIAS